MPIYRSWADFFVLSYVQVLQGLEMPFTVGNLEDTPRIKLFDAWLQQTGYIPARRSLGQGYQSSYVNSALLKELIANNKLITIFQNATRLRSGKLSRPIHADMSIRWLLHAFQSLPHIASKMTIVPVMISYDRIFEHLNLATEMISGKQKDFTLFSSLWNIYQRKENQMGNIYVKYLSPININTFVQKHYPEGIKTPELFKKAAIELTECLLKVQEEQTPVNLNSIIAACILQKNSEKLPMSTLL